MITSHVRHRFDSLWSKLFFTLTNQRCCDYFMGAVPKISTMQTALRKLTTS